MPNKPTSEDGESAPVAKTRKSLFRKKVVIGIGVVALAGTGLFIKFARGQGVTEGIEPDESPIAGTPTSPELEFAAIVQAVAAGAYKLKRFSTNGFNVEAQFRSNSGRGSWPADFTFEETGDYRYSHPYPGATAPRAFGDEIRRRIREAADG